jgi:16S rRNA (cytosine967-C5)-methyltransferase
VKATEGRSLSASATISPARSAAFAILERVASTSAHSDDLLHSPAMNELSQADRNLAMTLVLGVLRWQIALDARMQPMLQRPEMALPVPVATALRMGAFQLEHLDRIPAHAALSESVELVRAAGHAHAAGMVNAILRKLTREPAPQPKLYETTAGFASRLGHPEWMVARWVREYGRSAAMAICAYDQQPPPTGGLFAADSSGDATPLMDDGSRLIAELAAAAHAVPRRIWDCCAAPGGKTVILAHRHPESEILATDANPRRVKALAARMLHEAPTVRVMEADATHLQEDEGNFDLILCDVPCSGTGTLARNPEIKQRLQPSDIARQAERQRKILSAALGRLNPGGHLLYSTCSLEREENEAVVSEVMHAQTGIELLSVEKPLTELAQRNRFVTGTQGLMRSGHLRTLPGVGFAGDGFFAALFHRL